MHGIAVHNRLFCEQQTYITVHDLGFCEQQDGLAVQFYCDTDSIGMTESSEIESDTFKKRFIKGIFM